MKKEILRIENITLKEKEITYLNLLNFYITEGEIVGLLGTNGHGIKHLVKLICDNPKLEYGKVYYNKKLVNSYLHKSNTVNKVFVISQKSKLIKNLTIADNIFVLRKGFKKYVIRPKVLALQVKQIFDLLQIELDPNMLVEELSNFESCAVELVKAILAGAKLVIIYEISELLSNADLPRFHELIRYYARKGISFLYVANHHEETFEICTRRALFDNEKVVKVLYPEDMDEEHIEPFVKRIQEFSGDLIGKEKVIFEFRDVVTENLRQLNCKVMEGECLTLLDYSGTAIEDLEGLVIGRIQPDQGKLLLDEKEIIDKKRVSYLRKSVGVIVQDPIQKMVFPDMSFMENLSFLVDEKISRSIIKNNIIDSIRKEYAADLGTDIEAEDVMDLPVSSIYNLIYYRILLLHPKIVFILQPFYSADMYLRVHIANLITRLRKEHITVVIITTQVTDTLAVSDRLCIIEEGRITPEHQNSQKQIINDNFYGDRFMDRITNK